MKTKLMTMLATLGLVAGVGAIPAAAEEIKTNVPFAFYMGSVPMPAGTYRVERSHINGSLTLRNMDTQKAKLSIASSAYTQPGLTRLVFKKVDSTYFLYQVWYGGLYGSELHASKMQREMRVAALETITIPADRLAE